MRRIIAIVTLLLLLCGCNGTGTAFTVNDTAVEKAELVFYMNRSLDVVVSDIETEYGLLMTDDGFWDSPAGDSTPLEILKNTAVEEIARIKTEMQCAESHDIHTLPLSFAKQKKAWERDNNNRLRQEAAGELVYGQALRSFYTFFNNEHLTMRAALILKLEETGKITVTESDKRAYYNANRDTLKEDYEKYEVNIARWLLEERYEAYIGELLKKAKIEYKNMTVNTDDLS